MHSKLLHLALGLTLAGSTFAVPTEDGQFIDLFDKRVVSPDNTCGKVGAGKNKGYTCDPKAAKGGACCSAYVSPSC